MRPPVVGALFTDVYNRLWIDEKNRTNEGGSEQITFWPQETHSSPLWRFLCDTERLPDKSQFHIPYYYYCLFN